MRRFATSIMARICLLAGIVAYARRSSRLVSAFQISSNGSTGRTLSHFSDRRYFMNTQISPIRMNVSTDTVSEATKVIKRIKTANAEPSDVIVSIEGWVRTVRKQKTLAFVEVNDGSSLSGIQCVLAFDDIDVVSKKEIDKLTTGCAVELTGKIVPSGGKQKLELSSSNIRIVGACPGETYPLAKKCQTLEYFRTIVHLRPRPNTITAVARVRSVLAGAIHRFFQDSGFLYVQTPLITASDCEGAGEMFRVTTMDLDNIKELPEAKDENGILTGGVDYSEDFFGKPAYLTVSGQLGGETHACALGDIYTFRPTFRAENSQTARHLAEFIMVEPEMAFANLESAMNNAENMLRFVIQEVLDKCDENLTFFNKFYDKELKKRLQKIVSKPFIRISYWQAIEYLQKEIANHYLYFATATATAQYHQQHNIKYDLSHHL